jgi:anti-sigma factor RsiW
MSGTTNCSEYEWMIGPLLDGELPSADADAADRHVRECPTCGRLAESFRSFDRLASRLAAPPAVTTEEWARVLDRVRKETISVRLGMPLRVRDWLVPVFSLAALLVLGTWVGFSLIEKEAAPPDIRLDRASIEALKEMDNPEIELKVTPDAIIIKDSTNL